MTRTGERSVDKCLVSLELCNKALHDSWYPKVVPQSLSWSSAELSTRAGKGS